MKRFLIMIERANGKYSAYSPDLPGCVATGKTVEQTESNMYQAVQMHLDGLREDGIELPEPQSLAEYIVLAEAG